MQQRNLEKAWDSQGAGPHRADPGNLRRTRRHAAKGGCRSSWRISPISARGWSEAGPIWSGSAAASAFSAAPAKPRSKADRRLIGERIVKIKRELEEVKRTRGLGRQARKSVPFPVIALVGYTNAGKSTLFNRLTKSKVLAKDLLFATLDPTMRGVKLPRGAKIILSDTVGFIADLPTELVAAFRATLEEVLEADVIVHVRDAAHDESEAQKADVLKVLAELGVPEDRPLLEVLNKIDLLPAEARAGLLAGNAGASGRSRFPP